MDAGWLSRAQGLMPPRKTCPLAGWLLCLAPGRRRHWFVYPPVAGAQARHPLNVSARVGAANQNLHGLLRRPQMMGHRKPPCFGMDKSKFLADLRSHLQHLALRAIPHNVHVDGILHPPKPSFIVAVAAHSGSSSIAA